QAHVRRAGFLEELLQAGAFLAAVDLPGDADVLDPGHEHQEPAGQGDLLGDARALGGDGLLGDLDDDLLALGKSLLDLWWRSPGGAATAAAAAAHRPSPAAAFGAGPLLDDLGGVLVLVQVDVLLEDAFGQVGSVQKGRAGEAYFDEGRLHSGEHGVDAPLVDV